jgi:urease accessory protein
LSGGEVGVCEVGFSTAGLSHLYQRQPLRVLFPIPESGDLPIAAIATTSGGIVGGDRQRIEIRLGAGARAHATTAAAEKVYRSLGATSRIAQSFVLGADSWLEFLPPETILYDGARLARRTSVDLAAGAGFLGGGITVFGRRARGERFTRGFLHDLWEIRRDGTLVWGDALLLDGDIAATIADPACFDGAAACATLILAVADPQPFLAPARDRLGEGRCGATIVNGVLVARWLADDPSALRRAYADLACYLRHRAMGLPPLLPRLWHV